MDEFIAATAWRGSSFLRTRGGETWRVWFAKVGEVNIERLTVGDGPNYREPIAELDTLSHR